MAKPDVPARLAALDPQLILAQQADRLGSLEQVRERGRAVPLALQGLRGISQVVSVPSGWRL